MTQIGSFRKGGTKTYIGNIDTLMLKTELTLEADRFTQRQSAGLR
jgi:uncharacterized protein (DUF736 family)